MTRRERGALEQLLRRGQTGLWIAARAQAALLAAAGASTSEIARRVGRDRQWVRARVRRFVRHRLTGLAMPRARDGRQSFPPEERHEVLALACHPQTELVAARTH